MSKKLEHVKLEDIENTRLCKVCGQEVPLSKFNIMALKCDACESERREFEAKGSVYKGTLLQESSEKPPLGIMPKWLHDEKRMYEIIKAVARYGEANMPVPFEWMEELESLIGPVLNRMRKEYPTIPEEARR